MAQRQRAPHRQGRRTTLTVPDSVAGAAERLARELGTTANDALVRLAEEGISVRERRERIAALAQERRRAVAQGGHGDDVLGFPPPDELREAMLGGRRDP